MKLIEHIFKIKTEALLVFTTTIGGGLILVYGKLERDEKEVILELMGTVVAFCLAHLHKGTIS